MAKSGHNSLSSQVNVDPYLEIFLNSPDIPKPVAILGRLSIYEPVLAEGDHLPSPDELAKAPDVAALLEALRN